jgi:hypothetical protein
LYWLSAAALPQAERSDLQGATHMLNPMCRAALYTYTDATPPLHPDLVPAIVAFLGRNPHQ